MPEDDARALTRFCFTRGQVVCDLALADAEARDDAEDQDVAHRRLDALSGQDHKAEDAKKSKRITTP